MLKFLLKKYYKYFYNSYWKKHSNKSWDYGINVVDKLVDNIEFKSILDAGCGRGDVIRWLLSNGYDAYGIELSDFVLKNSCKDLLEEERVKIASLERIPYCDNLFDVVFCSDVFEHIPEQIVDKCISELVRVSNKYLFLTINLRPSSNNNKYHITLKSRSWWTEQFLKHGVHVDQRILNKIQNRNSNLSDVDILINGPAKSIIHEMDWFINNMPYSFNGELEPWFFVFRKEK